MASALPPVMAEEPSQKAKPTSFGKSRSAMKAARRSVPMLKKMAMARVCPSGAGLSRVLRAPCGNPLLCVRCRRWPARQL